MPGSTSRALPLAALLGGLTLAAASSARRVEAQLIEITPAAPGYGTTVTPVGVVPVPTFAIGGGTRPTGPGGTPGANLFHRLSSLIVADADAHINVPTPGGVSRVFLHTSPSEFGLLGLGSGIITTAAGLQTFIGGSGLVEVGGWKFNGGSYVLHMGDVVHFAGGESANLVSGDASALRAAAPVQLEGPVSGSSPFVVSGGPFGSPPQPRGPLDASGSQGLSLAAAASMSIDRAELLAPTLVVGAYGSSVPLTNGMPTSDLTRTALTSVLFVDGSTLRNQGSFTDAGRIELFAGEVILRGSTVDARYNALDGSGVLEIAASRVPEFENPFVDRTLEIDGSTLRARDGIAVRGNSTIVIQNTQMRTGRDGALLRGDLGIVVDGRAVGLFDATLESRKLDLSADDQLLVRGGLLRPGTLGGLLHGGGSVTLEDATITPQGSALTITSGGSVTLTNSTINGVAPTSIVGQSVSIGGGSSVLGGLEIDATGTIDITDASVSGGIDFAATQTITIGNGAQLAIGPQQPAAIDGPLTRFATGSRLLLDQDVALQITGDVEIGSAAVFASEVAFGDGYVLAPTIGVAGDVVFTGAAQFRFRFGAQDETTLPTDLFLDVLTADQITGWASSSLVVEFPDDPLGPRAWALQRVDLAGGRQALRLSQVAVPEPGTWALLATGLAGLAVAGRRRMRR